jgi:hypothetical protein
MQTTVERLPKDLPRTAERRSYRNTTGKHCTGDMVPNIDPFGKIFRQKDVQFISSGKREQAPRSADSPLFPDRAKGKALIPHTIGEPGALRRLTDKRESSGRDGTQPRQSDDGQTASIASRAFIITTSDRYSGLSESGADHSPAIVIRSINQEPVWVLPGKSQSLPTATSPANIVLRLPAMVISSTGYWISPSSTQKPAAPRE